MNDQGGDIHELLMRPYRRWLPKHHFVPYREVSAGLPCLETGEVGIRGRLPSGEVLRLRLQQADVLRLIELLAESQGLSASAVQSAKSSDSPSVEGSTTPGQAQYPPASSSTTCCGVGNGPASRSPSSVPCHPPARCGDTTNSPMRLVVPAQVVAALASWRHACRLAWKLRRVRGLTYRTLAELSGCYASHVSDYFSVHAGRRDLPAKNVAGVELVLGNTVMSQWLAQQSKLTVLEEMQADRAALDQRRAVAA